MDFLFFLGVNFVMSIIWFDTINRLSKQIEPLNRAGYLLNKNYPVERVFDHMAFSYRIGAPSMEFKITIKGKETIVRENHCMLMLPGDYCITEPLQPCNELYFVFEKPERLFFNIEPQRDEFGLFIPDSKSQFFEYEQLFRRLLTNPLTPALCTQLDCLACAMLGCTFYNGNTPVVQSPIEKIEGYINSHYSEDIDFVELSQRFGLSFTTFRRLWNSRHNQGPGATIIALRNRHAKEMLLNMQLSIGEVAALVGYQDTHYFARFFKRCNNLTPSEYREKFLTKKNINTQENNVL